MTLIEHIEIKPYQVWKEPHRELYTMYKILGECPSSADLGDDDPGCKYAINDMTGEPDNLVQFQAGHNYINKTTTLTQLHRKIRAQMKPEK